RHTRCLSDWSSDVCSSDLEMWLPTGSPMVTPATTCAESALGGGVVKLLVVEKAQLRAAAASHAYPSTTTLVGNVAIAAARLRLRSEESRVGKECGAGACEG